MNLIKKIVDIKPIYFFVIVIITFQYHSIYSQTIQDAGISTKNIINNNQNKIDNTQKTFENLSAEHLPIINTKIDKNRIHLGEITKLSISIERNKDARIYIAQSKGNPFDPFEKRNQKNTEKEIGQNKIIENITIDLQAFKTGDLEIPAIEFAVVTKDGKIGKVETEPIKVKVLSYLSNEPEPKLKDETQPVPVYEKNWTLIYILSAITGAILLTILIFFIRWLWIKFKPPKPVPKIPPRPPYDVAWEKLAQLKLSHWLEEGHYKEFYSLLSEILRGYLGSIYDFDGLESTSSEVIEYLKKWDKEIVKKELFRTVMNTGEKIPLNITLNIPSTLINSTDNILQESDLVKFAKYSPPKEDGIRDLNETENIINMLRNMAWGVYQTMLPIEETLKIDQYNGKSNAKGES